MRAEARRRRPYLRRRLTVSDRPLRHDPAGGSAGASAAEELEQRAPPAFGDEARLALSAPATPGASGSPAGTSGGRVANTTRQSGRSSTGSRSSRLLMVIWKVPLDARANGVSL